MFTWMTAPPGKTLRRKKLRREKHRLSRRCRHCLSGPQAHLMRTLSHRKKSVSVNVTSSASPLSAPELLEPEPGLASAQAPELPAAAGATD
jgi:hypothetical protein